MAGPGGLEVGRASVRVVPDTSGFSADLRKELQAIERSLKVTIGAEVDSSELVNSAREAVKVAEQAAGEVDVDMDVDGSALAADATAAVEAAQAAAGEVDVDMDVDGSSLAAEAAAAVSSAQAAAGKIDVDMDVDASRLTAETRRAVTIAQAAAGTIDIKVGLKKASVLALTATLAGATAATKMFGTGMLTASAKVLMLSGAAGAATVAVAGLAAPLAAMASAAVAAVAPMAALGAAMAVPAIAGAGVAILSLKSALSGFGDALAAESVDEFNAAIADMGPNAQAGATALRGLKESFSEVQDAVQEDFWGAFTNVGDLAALMEPLKSAMSGFAVSAGEAASSVVAFVSSGSGMSQFSALTEGGSAAMGNLAAAAGSVLQGLISIGAAAAPILEQLTGSIATAAEQWASSMSSAFEDGSLTTFFESAVEKAQGLWTVMSQLGGIVSGVFGAMSAAGQPFLGTIGQIIGETDRWVNSVQGQTALTDFFTSMGDAVAAVMPLVGQIAGIIGSTLAPAISTAIQALAPFVSTLLDALGPALESLSGPLETLATALGEGLAALAPALQPLAEALGQIMEAIAPLLPILGNLIASVLPVIAPLIVLIVQGLSQLIQWLQPLLPVILAVVAAFILWNSPIILIVAAIGLLIGILTQIVPIVWNFITAVVSGFINMCGTVISTVSGWVGSLIGWFGSLFSGAWNWITNLVSNVVSGFGSMVSSVVSTVSGWVSSVVNFFSSLSSQARAKASEMWDQVTSAFSSGVSKAVGFVSELPGKALSALGDVGSLLVSSGKALIQGFIDGIKSMIGAVGDAVGSVVSKARDFFPFSPAKVGPFSGRGWVLYSGRSIGTAFAQGIDDTAHLSENAADRMMRSVSGNLSGYEADTLSLSAAVGNGGRFAGVDTSVSIGTIVAADPSVPLREAEQLQLKAQIKGGVI